MDLKQAEDKLLTELKGFESYDPWRQGANQPIFGQF
jgi:hypothetical protein